MSHYFQRNFNSRDNIFTNDGNLAFAKFRSCLSISTKVWIPEKQSIQTVLETAVKMYKNLEISRFLLVYIFSQARGDSI